MNCIKYILLAQTALLTAIGHAASHNIDANGGQLTTDAEGDYYIATDSGGGNGVSLATPTVQIRSLHHDQLTGEVAVKIDDSQLLRCSVLSVAKSGAVLRFTGASELGVASATSAGTAQVDVQEGAQLYFTVPFNAGQMVKQGAGSVYASNDLVASVTNKAGAVYFFAGLNSYFGLKSDNQFVFRSNSLDGKSVDLTVDHADNGGAGVVTDLVSPNATESIGVEELTIAGGNDVRVVAGMTVYQHDVADQISEYTSEVPECVVVGSNSVGVLRVEGCLKAKLAIADGSSSAAKGAVYVGSGATVTNFSAVTGEALLGRSGYAALDVAGDYVAYGGWYGAVAGQLSLNITGSFVHPGNAVRASGFSLGGSGAYASVTIDGGEFDVSGLGSDVSLPYQTGARAVNLTVEDNGAFDLGSNKLSLDSPVVLNVNSDAMLVSKQVVIANLARLQLNGGYLGVEETRVPFTGTAYAFADGFGIEVDSGKTATFDSSGKPIAPTGNGVDAIALGSAVAGRKFIGPPIVVIEDDDGEGATAVAEMSDGEVTAIRVTGRGVDYENPVAKLVYGSEEIALGAVTISENVAGALLKKGAGTLTISAATGLKGAKIYEGTVSATVDNALTAGPLYLAAGAVLNVGSKSLTFSDFTGSGTIQNGPVTLTGLTADGNRFMTGDVDTLNFSQLTLKSGAGITIKNFEGLDRSKSYTIYNFTGTLTSLPSITEATYDAGLSRSWQLAKEDGKLILRYIGGSLYIIY